MPTRALRTASSGMYAQQVNIQVISNNIANINTTSFKKARAEFKDLIYQEVTANPQNSEVTGTIENPSSKIQVGTGVKPSSTQKILTQGDLAETGHQLDIAIHGEGFLQVRRADGTFGYTRDGSMKLSADGSLVTSSGNIIEPGFTITEDAVEVSITRDGRVSLKELDGSYYELGSLELVKFVNPGGLASLGDNIFGETEQSGPPIIGTPGSTGFGEVHQGYLESSNVDIVEEMIAMITAQRAYEINSKTVKTVEEMMTMANNLKRG
ncbi:MAG: flagellar basal-body rod protein FlgG [Melioribacteraceae bacterium]|nr:flagellar basal-body rod protein FlgG [Melioribacteraceae bacterium]MCF8355155.1 flagellar basal-body rod protein FlgG [Melioribacteraceae bacterium]MCF8392484.1 flagellar basal-body rod protein FlgG [Melioribacteraceae bacterium]MCF8418395.1 flagellar basal-body rod protein FlgG [Melioribacteraceae bacterium]